MRQYLGSAVLRDQVARFWAVGRPVGAICHGVLVLARTRDTATGRSVLAGRRTTCLPKYMEQLAYLATAWRLGRYRTYPAYVEDEVKAALDDPDSQFQRGPITLTARGTAANDTPAFAVTDRNYLSARWPGDAYLFARRFCDLLRPPPRPITAGRERPVRQQAAIAGTAGYCAVPGWPCRRGSATEVELTVALGHHRPPQWQHPGKHAVPEVQARHPGEDPLRSPDHRAGRDVVSGVMPGAHQAAVLIDAATRQVGAQMAAPAGDCEITPVGVPDGIAPYAHHLAWRQIGSRAHPLLCAHHASFLRPPGPCPPISTLGRDRPRR
jgi:putative intracellular protease/amidase